MAEVRTIRTGDVFMLCKAKYERSSISVLYSLTTLAGSKAIEALLKNCFFQFWIVFGVISYFFDNCDIVNSDSSNSKTTFVLYSALKFFIYLFVIYLNSFSFNFISSAKQNHSFCCLIFSVHYKTLIYQIAITIEI